MTQENKKLSLYEQLVELSTEHYSQDQKDHTRFNFFECENHYTISWHCAKD